MENLLSIEETAEKLKTHPETIRRYLRKKELTGVKIGNGWRVRESDLSAFINDRVIQAESQEATP